MESILSDTALSNELSFAKSHLANISALKQKYRSTHVPSTDHVPKRATLVNVPVCAPPAPLDPQASTSAPLVTLTIKSTKPALVFSLSCSPTATIQSLKAQLATEQGGAGAPKAEEQRWVLKGKAMGDAKLLKEFDVQDGSLVNLMVKPSTTAAPPQLTVNIGAGDPMEVDATTTAAADVPSFTLSSAGAGGSDTVGAEKPLLNIETGPPPHERTELENVKLWKDALALLRRHGLDEDGARAAWESWFDASVRSGKISASEKARIREECDMIVLGGL